MDDPIGMDADEAYARVVERLLPGRILRGWRRLEGGISAEVAALDTVLPDGGTETLVLRRHGPADRERNPDIARDEFRLLDILWRDGLPVPRPVGFDSGSTLLPTPFVLLRHLPGSIETDLPLESRLEQMAAALARIHALDRMAELSFLPRIEDQFAALVASRSAAPDLEMAEDRVRARLAEAWPLPPRNGTRLLHGDFWPGNLLWQGGTLCGILDWEDAALGEPLADLAMARLELVWSFGMAAADGFARAYGARSGADLSDLPLWDLGAALRAIMAVPDWALDAATRRRMRQGQRVFTEAALAQAGG